MPSTCINYSVIMEIWKINLTHIPALKIIFFSNFAFRKLQNKVRRKNLLQTAYGNNNYGDLYVNVEWNCISWAFETDSRRFCAYFCVVLHLADCRLVPDDTWSADRSSIVPFHQPISSPTYGYIVRVNVKEHHHSGVFEPFSFSGPSSIYRTHSAGKD